MNRRKFISQGTLSASAVLAARYGAGQVSAVQEFETVQPAAAGYDIMKDVAAYRKLDAHCHVNLFD